MTHLTALPVATLVQAIVVPRAEANKRVSLLTHLVLLKETNGWQ